MFFIVYMLFNVVRKYGMDRGVWESVFFFQDPTGLGSREEQEPGHPEVGLAGGGAACSSGVAGMATSFVSRFHHQTFRKIGRMFVRLQYF
jgi:hypothetical protein